jgi:hypothetical protein
LTAEGTGERVRRLLGSRGSEIELERRRVTIDEQHEYLLAIVKL